MRELMDSSFHCFNMVSGMTSVPCRAALEAEAKRLEENAQWTATAHYCDSDWMGVLYRVLGLAPAVLGALGGWKFFADPALATPGQVRLAAALSLASGIAGSILSFWRLSDWSGEHHRAASKFKIIEHEARQAWQLHTFREADDAFDKRMVDLGRRYLQACETTPRTTPIGFLWARVKIGNGVFKTADAEASDGASAAPGAPRA